MTDSSRLASYLVGLEAALKRGDAREGGNAPDFVISRGMVPIDEAIGGVAAAMTDFIATPTPLYQGIRDILLSAKTQARRAVNDAMVQAYWHVGRLIIEDEQGGEKRAEYGKGVLTELSRRLSVEFGKGFSTTNLKLFRQFYLVFPISHTLCGQSGLGRLSWSHLRNLLRVADMNARAWYANEAANQSWSATAPCWKARGIPIPLQR